MDWVGMSTGGVRRSRRVRKGQEDVVVREGPIRSGKSFGKGGVREGSRGFRGGLSRVVGGSGEHRYVVRVERGWPEPVWTVVRMARGGAVGLVARGGKSRDVGWSDMAWEGLSCGLVGVASGCEVEQARHGPNWDVMRRDVGRIKLSSGSEALGRGGKSEAGGWFGRVCRVGRSGSSWEGLSSGRGQGGVACRAVRVAGKVWDCRRERVGQ